MSHAECEDAGQREEKHSARHEIELNIETFSVSHLVKYE